MIDDQFSEKETARRAEAALLRALNTPPKRQSEMKLGKPRGSKAKINRERSVSDVSRPEDAPTS